MLRYLHKAAHRVLITGGAGFIGCNLASHLLATTDVHLTIYDNLSRPGSSENLAWLKQQAGPGRLRFVRGDVRNSVGVAQAVLEADEVFHFATRGASGAESRSDFEVNVTGTLNVLDAARRSSKKPMVLFASVRSAGEGDAVWADDFNRQGVQAADSRSWDMSQAASVDSQAVYEVSMRAAEGFMCAYARRYGVRTIVFRLDTIAGPRQFGGDHGAWISNDVRAVLAGRPARVAGNGAQVHDVLHVGDLVDAMAAARAYLGVTAGKVYNIGGGAGHTMSEMEMIGLIERLCYRKARVERSSASRGTSLFHAPDNWQFLVDTGWMVRRSLEQTVRDVVCFCRASESGSTEAAAAAPQFSQAA